MSKGYCIGKRFVPRPHEFFDVLRSNLRKYSIRKKGLIFPGGAVGYVNYEAAKWMDKIGFRKKKPCRYPLAHFGFYREFIIYRDDLKTYEIVVLSGEKTRQDEKRLDRLEKTISAAGRKCSGAAEFKFRNFHPDISRSRFIEAVRKTKNYIAAGDIYQANLSQRFSFRFSGDAFKVYEKLRDINPSPYASFLKIRGLQIVSNSPERLVSKRGAFCQTEPIAGTYPRGKNRAVSGISRALLANEKERAEHVMLVDLERNDLGRVCHWPSVRVRKMMDTEKYSHVVHIVSWITGRLRAGRDGTDLFQALFPGGTITGCPKIRCMQIIDEMEPAERGIYTGSIGWFGFDGNLDFNIAIRTLVLQKKQGYLQVGAGIVHDSDPVREYEETIHKGKALYEGLLRAAHE